MTRILLAVCLVLLPSLAFADGYVSPRAWRAVSFEQVMQPAGGGGISSGGSFSPALFAPAADNCAAVPYSFTSDTNTGLCSSAADTVSLITGGTARLTVGTTGNISLTANLGVNGGDAAANNLAVKATGDGFGVSLINSAGTGAVAGIFQTDSGTQGGRIFMRAVFNGADTIDLNGLTGTGTFGTSVIAPTYYGSSAANGDAAIRGTSNATTTSSLTTITNIVTAAASTLPTVANVGANSCGTTPAAIAGNNNTGIITIGATTGTQCRVTFTFAAPTRWQCFANNETTANLARTTVVDTSNVDFFGTFVAGDVVTYLCFAR